MRASRRVFLGLGLGVACGCVRAEEETPTLDLLEFLGSFETPDGKWLDPFVFDDESAAEDATPSDNPPRD